MSARELFKKLGLEYKECRYHGELVSISYINDYNFSTKVRFDLENKMYTAYFGEDESAGYIDMDLYKAIGKQIEELGWCD